MWKVFYFHIILITSGDNPKADLIELFGKHPHLYMFIYMHTTLLLDTRAIPYPSCPR